MGGGHHELQRKSSQGYPQFTDRIRGPEIRHLDTDRLDSFTNNGQYKDVNLQSMMESGRVDGPEYLSLEVYSPPDLARPLFHEAVKHTFRPTRKGEVFGPSWSTHWFRVTIHKLPESWKNFERVQLEFDLPEAMVYTEEGEPLQGLTGGTDSRRVDFILPATARLKKTVFYIEASINGLFGVGEGSTINPPNPDRYFPLASADLVAPNMTAVDLFYDFWILKDLAKELPQNGFESHEALVVASKIMNTFQRGDQTSLEACRKLADKILGPDRDTHKVYKPDASAYVTAIGNCHIDTAWLWPFAETRRKIGRSWSSQVDLIDRYPESVFACSQAQQFKWMQQDYPKLASKIADKIKSGNFELIGGAWVEMDSNLPSGESLVRQFLFGQRLFENQSGKRCKVAWLPDSFGYSSQFPQIARLAGMDYFFTQKLSWNNINSFPHTTFNWQALDGTQILTHMTPNETYTSNADLGDVIRSQHQHKSLSEAKDSLLVFGYGDGGGGPHKDMFEKLRRCRGAADTNVPSLPKVKFNTVEQFYKDLERNSNDGKTLRTWSGELYFEFHRGTYTSQALTKRNNRRAEGMLHELEYFASLASLTIAGYTYPRAEVEALWEDTLLCQFHDVLPGSCIEMVYNDVHKMHAEVLLKGQKLVMKALEALGVVPSGTRTSKLCPINTLPWQRKSIVGSGDALYSVETEADEATTISKGPSGDVELLEHGNGKFVLSNANVCVQIQDGCITSYFDKVAHRELIPKGARAHEFLLFEDQPLNWQAWDVEIFHLDKAPRVVDACSSKVVLKDDLRATIEVRYEISPLSSMVATISLDTSTVAKPRHSQLDFTCTVDWHENKSFLKVNFPTTLRANEARYESQFGFNARPTHRNTTWDAAKFEVCCHKYADLSESRYGLAILNDCKYGFAVLGSTMTLSLLRAPKAPDAHADMGKHVMRYAMLSHAMSFEASNVTRAAAEFNSPLRLMHHDGRRKAPLEHFKLVQGKSDTDDTDHVILDTIKLSEDDDQAVILRVYEAIGAQGRVCISVPEIFGCVKDVCIVNLLEDKLPSNVDELWMEDGRWCLCLRPFEIVSIRFKF